MEQYEHVSYTLHKPCKQDCDNNNNSKQYAYTKLKLGCIFSSLFFCGLLSVTIWICLRVKIYPVGSNAPKIDDNTNSTEDRYHIFIPQHATNDTTTVQDTEVQYQKSPVSQSVVFILILISGHHFILSTNNTKTENKDNDASREYKSVPKSSGLRRAGLTLQEPDSNAKKTNHCHLQAQGKNVTTGITIPEDGLYYLYANLQITYSRKTKGISQVTHYIQRHSDNQNITIVERTLNIPDTYWMYETSTFYVPIRLHKDDIISMHVSDDIFVYNSRKSNIIGAIEVY